MKLGNSIGSPSGNRNGFVGRLQRGIEIARAIERVGEIGQHAGFEFQPGPRAAGKIDRLPKLMRPCGKFARRSLRESCACDRRNAQIRRSRLLGQLGHLGGVRLRQPRVAHSPGHLHRRKMRNELHHGDDPLRDRLQHFGKPLLGLAKSAEPDQDTGSEAFDPMLDIEPQNLIGIEAKGDVAVEAALFRNGCKSHFTGIERFVQSAGHEECLTEHGIHGCKTPDVSFARRQFDRVLREIDVIIRRRGGGQDPAVGTKQYRFVHPVRDARVFERLLGVGLYLIGRHPFSPTEVQDLTARQSTEPVIVLGLRLILQQRANSLPVPERFGGIGLADPLRGTLEMADSLQRLAGRFVVISQKPRELVELPPIERFDRFRDGRVQRDEAGSQLRRVSHLLDQRVTKPEKSLIVGRQIVQQLSLPELRYGFQQFVIGQGGDGLQDRHGDQPPDHGGRFEHLFGNFLKMVDARGNHRLHGRGQRDGVDSMFQPVGASLALEISTFRNRVGEFLDEEWIALRALDDIAAEHGQRRVLADIFAQQLVRLGPCQRKHHDLTIVRALHEGCREAGSEIDNEHRRGANDRVRQRLDKFFARRIDPVQILDQHHGSRVARTRTRERPHQIEQLYLQRSRIEFWRGTLRVRQAKEFEQQKQLLIGRGNRREAIYHPAP